jgi:septum site-determining protein MinC
LASIKIKGINNNLVFIFEEGRGEEYLEILKDKFSANPQLFDGSPVVFKGKGLNTLSFEDISQLQKLCLEYGMILNNIELNINRTFNKDLFIHRNVRSGQKIHSEGSVIVWGDVHESSEIIAGGDIIVLGKMEGIAHAGFYGNTRSIVFALNLCPGQIRIANTISSPAAEQDKKAIEGETKGVNMAEKVLRGDLDERSRDIAGEILQQDRKSIEKIKNLLQIAN